MDPPRHGRLALDRRFLGFPQKEQFARPHGGWIRAIRDALGMTASQLAARLRVAQPSIANLEASEQRGTIKLDSLARVADALDCDLVYALVPRRPLETMYAERAREVARERLRPVEQTMALERQSVDPSAHAVEDRVDEIAATLKPRELWEGSSPRRRR